MRVIIAGSRTITDLQYVQQAAVLSHFPIRQVVSGGARGVDKLGEEFARKAEIDLVVFKAQWARGLRAGKDRNIEMAIYADALIALHDGTSTGTAHMIEQMKTRFKPTFVYYPFERPPRWVRFHC